VIQLIFAIIFLDLVINVEDLGLSEPEVESDEEEIED